MSFVDELRQSRQTSQAIWIQFITAYDNKRNDLYVFFEGKSDSAYYLPELRRRWFQQGKIRVFICDGKEGVIAAYHEKRIKQKIINWKRVLFFVDKDWDDLLNINQVPQSKSFFVTDSYSIENYLVSVDTVEIVWTDIYKLPQNDPRLAQVLQQFQHGYSRFLKLICPMMVWAIAQKKQEKILALAGNRKEKGLNINNANLNKVFELDSDFKPLKKRNGFENLKKAASFNYQLNFESFKNELKKISGLEPKKYIRGKFELWYLISFLTLLSKTLTAKNQPKRAVIKVQLTYENAIEILGGKVPYPKLLNNFLDENLF